MKRIRIQHATDAYTCGVALHLLCQEHARMRFKITICPFIAPHIHASYFLQWQDLLNAKILFVEESCRCSDPAAHKEVDLTLGERRLQRALAASAIAGKLGLSDRSSRLAVTFDEGRRRVLRLRGSLSGKVGIVIGTGPSLQDVDLREWQRYPTISCNKIYLLDKTYRFRPSHYIVEDRLLLEDCASEIDGYTGCAKWFPMDRFGVNTATHYFPLWRSYEKFPKFSVNFESEVFTGWTVTFIMLQLAAFLGLRKILLLGVDGTYDLPAATYEGPVGISTDPDSNHFDKGYYGPGARFHAPQPERVSAAYAAAANALSDSGVEVINCSQRSVITCFPKKRLDSAVESSYGNLRINPSKVK